MKILAVDDEFNQLRLLEHSIKEAIPENELVCFQNPEEAFEWAKENQPEIAFLDISMPGFTGITLAKKLKQQNPKVNLIFVTGFYQEYAMDVLPLRFSGYLQKPVTADAVRFEIENLRFPLPRKLNGKRLRVKCFGDFEVFLDEKVLTFSKSKTKELFAYLVDRKGAQICGNKICAVLYEASEKEASNKSNLRKCVVDLRNTLKAAGMEKIFLKGFDSYALNTEMIECDYYDWEKNEAYAIRAFQGEYMTQYSWAEKTLAGIIEKSL